MTAIDEHHMTLTSPSAPGVQRLLRIDEQSEAMQLFFEMTDCLRNALASDQPDRILYRNRRMGMALGSDLVMPLDAAHGHWQTIAAMSDYVPCHCCENGNGRWAQIEVDWYDLAFVGRVCKTCFAALGMDGDLDE